MDRYTNSATPRSMAPQARASSQMHPRSQAGIETHAKRPGSLTKFVRSPKGIVSLLLVGLMVVAALHPSDRTGIFNVIVAVATASAIDIAHSLMRGNRKVLPDGGMVTGLIIGLVLSGSVHWPVVALTAAIAVLSKHLLKVKRKPIFNPAAFALLFALLFFHTGQSWWGDLADVPAFLLPLLILAGYMVTSKVNKFPQVLTFLGTYFLLLTLAASLHLGNAAYTPGDAMRIPIVNAALFFGFFMLTDPPTTPGNYGNQVTFSVLVAVVSVGVYLLFGGLSYLLVGLLVANLWKTITSLKPRVVAS